MFRQAIQPGALVARGDIKIQQARACSSYFLQGNPMIRRDFCKTSLALAGLALSKGSAEALAHPAAPAPAEELAKAPGLTKYVSEFIVNTKYEDIPENVIAIGKKTMLDGFRIGAGRISLSVGPAYPPIH